MMTNTDEGTCGHEWLEDTDYNTPDGKRSYLCRYCAETKLESPSDYTKPAPLVLKTQLPRGFLIELMASLGYQPGDKVVTITATQTAITVERLAVDSEGQAFIGPDGQGFAKHTDVIRVNHPLL